MIFRAIYLFFSYRRGGWSAQMEIQLHRYIEKAVLECCYWNPGHQSQASICCAPLYLTLTTMHLTFSFSFFLLFPPDLTLNHSNCILLEAVCVRSLQSLPHTHTPVWDWPRENLMKIKEEEESWTFTSLQFSTRHHVLARCRAPAVVFRGRSWGSRTELRLHSEESGSTLHAALWGKFHDSKFSTSKVMCEVPVPTVTTKAISTCLHGSQCLQG